ncbi:MAG: choloylglycine hydrolase family protein [Gammaproteobacteria bacterium]|nr:choloylglycine hydrolase family protein [Gammaproteobacteria bacterium]
MKRRSLSLILTLCAMLFYFNSVLACTSFRVTAKDGTIIIARSMEFALDMKSALRTSPRGRTFTTTAPDGKPGLSWKAKYGYLFLDAMNVDISVDGMNEAGLSFEALYLPGYAEYQTVPANHDSQALPYMNIGDWGLSNFKTVDEVRQALPGIFVFAQKNPGFGDMIFPLHFSFYDASGKGIVVEYIGGKLNIYDNQVGVMTNAPGYDWHLTNLKNYVQLKPTNPNPVVVDGVTFVATGQGAGMLGLPGDISPPSRFVKMAVLMSVAAPANDAKSAVNLAEHVINNVDIPMGLAREPSNNNYSGETTEWVDFKDLTNKIFYYRTYGDLSLHAVSMAKIDFSENAARLRMPIASPEYVQDMTDAFLKQKAN